MNAIKPSLRFLSVRRSLNARPILLPRQALPPRFARNITIRPPNEAPAESSSSTSADFQLVGGSGSSSQHPFSEVASPPTPSSSSGTSSDDSLSSNLPVSTDPPISTSSHLPPPPEHIDPIPLTQHPFDTHAFVSYLEKSGLNPGASVTLMKAVRELIVRRGEITKVDMVGKEDMENGAYLFRAALSELRTELSVRARNDGEALKAMSGAIRRGVDSLEQKMREDVQTLKHDVEMDMNNRKSETRSEMKGFEIAIEEINNKFTISLGDLRTEIESAKWDATRRAISIIGLLVLAAIAVSTLTGDHTKTPVPPPPAPSHTPIMRDMAVGPDEDLFDADEAVSEEKLEKILKESGLDVPVVVGNLKEGRRKGKEKEIVVDRI